MWVLRVNIKKKFFAEHFSDILELIVINFIKVKKNVDILLLNGFIIFRKSHIYQLSIHVNASYLWSAIQVPGLRDKIIR